MRHLRSGRWRLRRPCCSAVREGGQDCDEPSAGASSYGATRLPALGAGGGSPNQWRGRGQGTKPPLSRVRPDGAPATSALIYFQVDHIGAAILIPVPEVDAPALGRVNYLGCGRAGPLLQQLVVVPYAGQQQPAVPHLRADAPGSAEQIVPAHHVRQRIVAGDKD